MLSRNLLLLSLFAICARTEAVKFSYTVASSSFCGSSDPLYGVDVRSTVAAVNYALDYVNSNVDLLPGSNLSYETVNFARVSA